jgi:hypothetical protein
VAQWAVVAWWAVMARLRVLLATQMSYNDMKSQIEGLLLLEPASVAPHVGATLRAALACGVEEGVAPASREPSTL